jgi:hypothetical protein
VTKKLADKRPDSVGQDASLTIRPPFDPAAFARESEAGVRAAEGPASNLPTVRPPADDSAPAIGSLSEVRGVAGSIPDVQEVEMQGPARDLGGDDIPFVAVSRDDLPWFDLAPEAADLLALVDGISSVDALAARASFSTKECVSLLQDLAALGVVGFR